MGAYLEDASPDDAGRRDDRRRRFGALGQVQRHFARLLVDGVDHAVHHLIPAAGEEKKNTIGSHSLVDGTVDRGTRSVGRGFPIWGSSGGHDPWRTERSAKTRPPLGLFGLVCSYRSSQ